MAQPVGGRVGIMVATFVPFSGEGQPAKPPPMMSLRSVLSLCLVLLIAVTSQQMALARGTMKDAAGQIILCTGQGVHTVVVDHQGNPIEVVHICPDCALTAPVPADRAPRVEVGAVHMQVLSQTIDPSCETWAIPIVTAARGPPRIG